MIFSFIKKRTKVKLGWKRACLIIAKPNNEDLPKDEYILTAETRNADGIGIALWKNNSTSVLIKKDFKTGKEVCKWMHTNVTKEDCLIVHLRFATAGLKDEGNRHPFPIVDISQKELMRVVELNTDLVVAHNGVMSQYGGDTTFSDTQRFVMDILADSAIRSNLKSIAIRKLIKDFIGSDKLAILDKDGILLLIGDYHEHEGCYYSNHNYEKPAFTSVSTYDYKRKNYFDTSYERHYGYLTETEKNDIKQKALPFKDTPKPNQVDTSLCDNCGEYKKVKPIIGGKNECYALCKRCRKGLSKGKITITDIDFAIASRFIGVNKDKEKPKDDLEQCNSCLIWFDKAEIKTLFGDLKCCSKCAKDLEYETPEVKANKKDLTLTDKKETCLLCKKEYKVEDLFITKSENFICGGCKKIFNKKSIFKASEFNNYMDSQLA